MVLELANWLHLRQEVVAVAIVRSAKECRRTAGGGCHWRTTLSKMGGLVTQRLANTLLP